jgi:hypothetical protein
MFAPQNKRFVFWNLFFGIWNLKFVFWNLKLMSRYKNILFFILTTIILLAAGKSYAQPQVPIPNPNWPLDSVVNGSVHYYSVPGDPNYASPSTFVWTVEGGRLFYDQALSSMAGNGTVASVLGNSSNSTTLWVVWDSFDTALDTGYVYVYEISADSCQRSDSDAGKFQGMRIKVSSPPKARFIRDKTIACSNLDSARIIVEIEGMPPYDLIYTINGGDEITWHITAADLSDLDGDLEADNVSFFYSGLSSAPTDMVYDYQLVRAESGGVVGEILNYSSHTLFVHLQPPAPVIRNEWTEVTTMTDNIYTYHLDDPGVNATEWLWYLRDWSSNLVDSRWDTVQTTFPVIFNRPAGLYYVEAQYIDDYGCLSLFDRLDIELFDLPTIAFSDSTPSIINCSATMPIPNEQFEFVIEYTGARTFGFTYEVYDYEDVMVDFGSADSLTQRTNSIFIDNKFINDSDENKPWKVVIKTAKINNDPGVNVNILDSDIEGGRDERIIMIYPKPFIHDDIDFAN